MSQYPVAVKAGDDAYHWFELAEKRPGKEFFSKASPRSGYRTEFLIVQSVHEHPAIEMVTEYLKLSEKIQHVRDGSAFGVAIIPYDYHHYLRPAGNLIEASMAVAEKYALSLLSSYKSSYKPATDHLRPVIKRSQESSIENEIEERSKEFVVTPELVRLVLQYQADGDPRNTNHEVVSDLKLREEISDRVLEAIADLGYRWQQRGSRVSRVASMRSGSKLDWCNDELARILLFELNVSVLGGMNVLSALMVEFFPFVGKFGVRGDWGHLIVDGCDLVLCP